MQVGVGAAVRQLRSVEYTITDRGDDADTTDFEDQGADSGLIGIIGCDITFTGHYNFAEQPGLAPPGIFPRDDLANVRLYLSRTEDKFYDFPLVRVLECSTRVGVRAGAVTFDGRMKSQGPYTRPV